MRKILTLLFGAIALFGAEDIYLSYDKIERSLYVGEVFELKAKAIITATDITNISTVYTQNPTVKILSENNIWRKIDENNYELYLLLQTKKTNFKLPDIRVTTTNTSGTTSSQLLEGESYEAVALVKSPIFSKVLAKELTVKGFKTIQKSNEENILELEIVATGSNLSDFGFDRTIAEQQNSVQNLYTFAKAANKYQVVLPANKKIFEFEYFNLTTNKFEKKTIPVKLKEDEVSTQTELAPKSGFSNLYKLLAILMFAGLLYYLGQKYEFKLLKILAFVSLALIYPLLFDNDVVVIKKGSMISILPTTNSTIFEITQEEYKVQKLYESDEYYKIKLDDDRVGWVEKKNVL